MRKLWTVVLALALSLTACAGGGQNDAPPLYNLQHVEKIDGAGAFSEELEELDSETAFALYQLSGADLTQEDLKQCAVLRSAGATCEEAAVLVFSDAEQAKRAAEALNGYLQDQIDANTDYRPAEIPKLEAALVDQRGESVLLVVANDLEAAKDAGA